MIAPKVSELSELFAAAKPHVIGLVISLIHVSTSCVEGVLNTISEYRRISRGIIAKTEGRRKVKDVYAENGSFRPRTAISLERTDPTHRTFSE